MLQIDHRGKLKPKNNLIVNTICFKTRKSSKKTRVNLTKQQQQQQVTSNQQIETYVLILRLSSCHYNSTEVYDAIG